MANIPLFIVQQKHSKISKSTLRNRLQGHFPLRMAHVHQKNLSESEDNALMKYITTLTKNSLPPSYTTIREMAEAIRKTARRVDSIEHVNYSSLGKNWVKHFINHHPQLIATCAHRIDAPHVDQSTEHGYKNWLS